MKKEKKMVEQGTSKRAFYLASTEDFSGKSIVTIALALLAKDLGIKTGYFKPIGLEFSSNDKKDVLDEDVETMKRILSLEGETHLYCPLMFRKNDFLEEFSKIGSSKLADAVVTSYQKASEDKDIMLIEGHTTLSVGSFLGCSVPKLASDFNACILLVTRFTDDFLVDDVLQARDYCMKWGVPLFGVILNRIPMNKMEKVKRVIVPLLEENGVGVFGFIPEDKMLSALAVREVQEVIGGKVLAGQSGMDRTVQTVLVGAMTSESALRYFRKAKDELVITGGDRTDIIFAALEAGASALILTGNLYPSVKIFSRADDLSVPIILVPNDTYTTLQQVQRIVGRIKPRDNRRINRAKRLVEENVSWKRILTGGSTSD
jgi:BioD-like phosphotransacetylase family protein